MLEINYLLSIYYLIFRKNLMKKKYLKTSFNNIILLKTN